jgi:hypothetical protein
MWWDMQRGSGRLLGGAHTIYRGALCAWDGDPGTGRGTYYEKNRHIITAGDAMSLEQHHLSDQKTWVARI